MKHATVSFCGRYSRHQAGLPTTFPLRCCRRQLSLSHHCLIVVGKTDEQHNYNNRPRLLLEVPPSPSLVRTRLFSSTPTNKNDITSFPPAAAASDHTDHNSTSFSTTTTTTDSSIDRTGTPPKPNTTTIDTTTPQPTTTELEDRFLSLEYATRDCLVRQAGNMAEYEQLLWSWHALLKELELLDGMMQSSSADSRMVQAVERMEDLFCELEQQQQQRGSSASSLLSSSRRTTSADSLSKMASSWLLASSTDNDKAASSSSILLKDRRYYKCMMDAYSRYQPAGPRALNVLQCWNEALQGDLEQAPTKEDYHAVLNAYASQDYLARQRQQSEQQGRNNNNMSNNNQDSHQEKQWQEKLTLLDEHLPELIQAVDVAWEVLQALQHEYHPDMRPDAVTHALALQCMARLFQVLKTSSKTVEQPELEQFQAQLEVIQKEFLNKLEPWMTQQMAMPKVLQEEEEIDVQRQDTMVWILRAVDVVVQKYKTLDKPFADWVQLWERIIRIHPLNANRRPVRQVLVQSATTILQQCCHEANELWNLRWFSSDSARTLCELIDTTIAALEKFDHPLLPNEHHYYLAIHARRRVTKDLVTDARIEEWIREIEKIIQHHFTTTTPTELSNVYSELMKVFYEAGQDERVERLWNTMAARHGSSMPMNSFSVSIVLKCLARSQTGQLRAARKAQEILGKVLLTDPSDPYYLVPTAQHYGSAMAAWRNTEHPSARYQCRRVFDRLLRDANANPELQPNEVHYMALIGTHGWTDRTNPKDPLPAISDEEKMSLFDTIEETRRSGVLLDRELYRAMLNALCRMRSEDADALARDLLDEMILSYEKGGREDLKLTNSFISKIMYICSRSGSPRAAVQCEAFLQRLTTDFEKHVKDPTMLPSADCYKSLIHAHLNVATPDSAIQAEQVLDRMEAAARTGMADFPTKMIYAQVIHAYGHSGLRDSSARAESILLRMAKSFMFGNTHARPDGRMCSEVLYAYARSDTPDKAERARALLSNMVNNYRSGDKSMKPEAASFVSVLNACAHTRTHDASTKSKLIGIVFDTLVDMKSVLGVLNEEAIMQGLLVVQWHVADKKDRPRCTNQLFNLACDEKLTTTKIIRKVRELEPLLVDAQVFPDNRNPNVKPARL